MPLPKPLDRLSAPELQLLEQRLEPVRFTAGACIFHAGAPGDSCYIIDEGEVRLEIARPELDTEGVLGYLAPGSLLGELALLDEQPRSASAYAETDVAARRLTLATIESLGGEHPGLAATVLRALGRDAARKLRQTTERLAEHIFAGDHADPEVDATVERAQAAQRALEAWDDARVDALLRDLAQTVAAQAEPLAEATVAETRIGNVAHKTFKNTIASIGVYQTMAGRVGRGPLAELAERRITEIAAPVGVVFGLVPQTNPVATAIFNTLIALKGRNALILSFHRACVGVGEAVGEIIRGVLRAHGAPEDLVQWVRHRTSRKTTAHYMSHPGVALVLATGGAGMVKAAYSSGTPAIGVGSGNAPCYVAADADVERAASAIVVSKSFDNGLICGAEHNLVVDASVADRLAAALEAAGAAVLSPAEAARFLAGAIDPRTNTLRAQAVGQSARSIAGVLGIRREHPIEVIVVPGEPDFESPMTGEKMAPILSCFTVEGREAAFDLCKRLLARQGAGHTAIIHSTDDATVARFGVEMPASRILVNSPGAQGVSGITTGLDPSFTLGCGTFGGNSTTDNVGYRHLLNVKRLARFAEPRLPGAPGPAVGDAAPAAARAT